ncbi:MAG: hypothetical protein ACYDDN_02675 [Candidatus Desulforudaceae bacterium]
MLRDQIAAAMKEAALQITEQIGAQRLATQLMSYPEQIRQQQDVVAQARRALDDAKAEVEQLRAVFLAAVASEINDGGKPKFSNEKAREAEVTTRMAANPTCVVARQDLHDAEDTYNVAQFDLQRLENEFRATIKAADLVSAQLNLLAGMGQ